jgi:hypothetical protein
MSQVGPALTSVFRLAWQPFSLPADVVLSFSSIPEHAPWGKTPFSHGPCESGIEEEAVQAISLGAL